MLQPFEFTAEKQSVIQGLVEGRIIQLIEDHVAIIPCFIVDDLLTVVASCSMQTCSVIVVWPILLVHGMPDKEMYASRVFYLLYRLLTGC